MLLALFLAAAPLPPQEAQFQPQRAGSDVRSQRPWVFSGELGWNGLAGVGVVVARHMDPQLTLEAGLGISGEGAKVGLRARVNFTTGPWSPFVGAGFLYGKGNGDAQVDHSGPRPFTYSIGPSPFVQLVAGAEYQSRAGLNFLAAAGYARLLGENLRILSGTPGADALSSLRVATGSGPVISVSCGYAF